MYVCVCVCVCDCVNLVENGCRLRGSSCESRVAQLLSSTSVNRSRFAVELLLRPGANSSELLRATPGQLCFDYLPAAPAVYGSVVQQLPLLQTKLQALCCCLQLAPG